MGIAGMDFLLIDRARNGDTKAYEKLVTKYYSIIYQYCLLHMHDRFDAEDVTQDVFMNFFENLYRYKEMGKTKNYLYTIAGNRIKNYYKKKKAVPAEELPEFTHNPMENVEIKLEVEQAMNRLPEEIREVAILFFFQELKQKDIAVVLNIKLSLVKYRIGRARELLSDYLEVNEK